VAAGVTYVAAQLELLKDGATYAERRDASYAAELAPLRAALGFSQILAVGFADAVPFNLLFLGLQAGPHFRPPQASRSVPNRPTTGL
jgi:hypothetical protein